jgi:anti-sigma factor RsiW
MDHERARADFIGLRDGDLPEEDRRALEEHLAVCAECRADWEAYCMTVDGVSGLRVLPPPADFADRVARNLDRGRTRAALDQLNLTGVRVAVLTLVLIMLFVMAYLTYLLLFSAPAPSGAQTHEQGDYHIIGPVKVQTQPAPDDRR